jgi:hypothetical protein
MDHIYRLYFLGSVYKQPIISFYIWCYISVIDKVTELKDILSSILYHAADSSSARLFPACKSSVPSFDGAGRLIPFFMTLALAIQEKIFVRVQLLML